jgi:DinB superfamily
MDDILMWVRPVLTITPMRWMNLIEALPVELVTKPPALGEWSAVECLQHLTDAERWIFPVRIKYLLAEQDFPAFDPDTQGTKPSADRSPLDLVAEFARLRTESLAVLSAVTPPDLVKRARHQELGPVTLNELLHEWAAHDLMHTVQAERAMMQPFIQGCGPWHRYFVDHVAQAK